MGRKKRGLIAVAAVLMLAACAAPAAVVSAPSESKQMQNEAEKKSESQTMSLPVESPVETVQTASPVKLQVTEGGTQREVVAFEDMMGANAKVTGLFALEGQQFAHAGILWMRDGKPQSLLYDPFTREQLGEVPAYNIPPQLHPDFPRVDWQTGTLTMGGETLSLPQYGKGNPALISPNGRSVLYVSQDKQTAFITDLRQEAMLQIVIDKLYDGDGWQFANGSFLTEDLASLVLLNADGRSVTIVRDFRRERTFLALEGVYAAVPAGVQKFVFHPEKGESHAESGAFLLDLERYENETILKSDEWRYTMEGVMPMTIPQFTTEKIDWFTNLTEQYTPQFSAQGRWMLTMEPKENEPQKSTLRIYDTFSKTLSRELIVEDNRVYFSDVAYSAVVADDASFILFYRPEGGAFCIRLL